MIVVTPTLMQVLPPVKKLNICTNTKTFVVVWNASKTKQFNCKVLNK